jgi:hypothetical protein|tara:strand:+ start:136 stop:525 length:390 start_codon:yes stop_codon:yes gene_type:complete
VSFKIFHHIILQNFWGSEISPWDHIQNIFWVCPLRFPEAKEDIEMTAMIKFGNSIIGMTITLDDERCFNRSSFFFFPFTLVIGSFEANGFNNYSFTVGLFSYDIQLNLGAFPIRHYLREVLDEFRRGEK